jgi:hypothetical protein
MLALLEGVGASSDDGHDPIRNLAIEPPVAPDEDRLRLAPFAGDVSQAPGP